MSNPAASTRGIIGRKMLIGLLGLVLVGAVGAALLIPRLVAAPRPGTVHDLDAPPHITWDLALAAGKSMAWTTLSADEALIYAPTQNPADPEVPIHVLNLETGSSVWQLSVSDHAAEVDTFWAEAHPLPGTDFVQVKLSYSASAPHTRHLLVERASGEIRHVLDSRSDTTLLSTESGTPYLVDHETGELSKLRQLASLEDRQWTVSAPQLRKHEIGELHVEHRHGLVLVGSAGAAAWTPSDNPGWFFAAGIADGSAPPWGANAAFNRFYLVDDVVVHLGVNPTQLYAMDRQGELLWQQPSDGLVTIFGDSIFQVTEDGAGYQLTQLDLRTGEPRWQIANSLPADVSVTSIDGHVVVLSHEEDQAAQSWIVSSEGHLSEPVQYASGSRAYFHRGNDRLYVTVSSSESTMLFAHQVAESQPMWTATYPAESTIVRLGQHLVMIDRDGQTMHGLGTP